MLFLGSNIGNFSEAETIQFLNKIHQTLQSGDRLLIGFDLKKEGSIIHAAYNDSAGVTEAFNKICCCASTGTLEAILIRIRLISTPIMTLSPALYAVI